MTEPTRRALLRSLAGAAGAVPLAPRMLVAGAVATGAAGANQAYGQQAAHGAGQIGSAAGQTRRLAEYAVGLRYEDIPPAVVQRAKDAITDTVATISYGAELPWSKMIAAYARTNGPGGKSRILGTDAQVHAPSAALANGAFAHAFELDNLTKPNSGSHPGATVFSSALALAQERGASGRDLITAFVAGNEVMIRVGLATKHSQEEHGYHAPGTTGPFGAAIACGRMLGLDAAAMQNALGIAASTTAGLLEFAKSGTGAMVKRLHLGRASEAGVMSASLAASGFTGPQTALEGEFGFLRVLCRDYDMNLLTQGLGETWACNSIMLKRYACHITAHTPVEATLALKAQHGFTGADIASIEILSTDRAVRVNNIPQPKDVLLAQYSIPFCVALAVYRNPVDPRSFDEAAVRNADIMGLAARVRMRPLPPPDNRSDMTSDLTITLKDGRSLNQRTTFFTGTPERPLDRAALEEKFLLLTRQLGEAKMRRDFGRLQALEKETDLAWIGA